MVIKTNVSALTASRNLMETNKGLTASLARLSSGSKMANPADNAGGFAVSLRLDAQLNRLSAAEDNVGNALSFSQTQDGYLKKVSKALDRLGELAMLSLDETKSNTDRSLYNTEFANLQQFVTKASERDFNGVSMFGSNGFGVTIDSEANTFNYTACDLTSATFTSATNSGSCNITTTANATTALGKVKDALNELASQCEVQYSGSSRYGHVVTGQFQLAERPSTARLIPLSDPVRVGGLCLPTPTNLAESLVFLVPAPPLVPLP